MTSADVTRRELSFGDPDPITGWFARNYTESTIKGSIQPQGTSMIDLPCGNYAKYPHTFFTEYIVHEGDQIVDKDLDLYELNTVVKWSWLNKFSHRVCEAVKKQFGNRPGTSGAWHLDTESLTTDPRSRHKKYLDRYLLDLNIRKDNGAGAYYITCFDQADYPIKQVFSESNVDLVFSIGKEPATAKTTYNHYTYAFEESVPINLYAVNKYYGVGTGVTATNLIEQGEQEIRRIITEHPLGSIRSIQSTKHAPVDLGDRNWLFNTTVTIKYRRPNVDYMPSLPTLTYGSGETAGTFIVPNCTKISPPTTLNNARLMVPGRIGNITQKLGMPDFQITLTCDLDMEPYALTWKRPQTTYPKGDVVPWQVFLDVQFNGQVSEEYQTLDLGWGGTLKVVLDEVKPSLTGEANMLDLVFYSYSPVSGAGGTYKEWFGIT